MNQLTFTISASLAFAASSLATCVLHAQDANATQQNPNPNNVAGGSLSTQQSNNVERKLEAMKSDAETNYIASPYNITQLGLRSYWQTTIPHRTAAPFVGMTIEDNEIFVWDHVGVITRVNSNTGAFLWQVATQSSLDKIYSVTILPAGITRAAVALTDAATVVFEEGSGGLLAQAPLRRVPATVGVACGNYVVFGDSEGRVIWLEMHESNIKNIDAPNSAPNQYAPRNPPSQRRTVLCIERFGALSLGKVTTVPVVVPRLGVLTVSTGGEICMFDANTSKPIWKYKSNAPFISKPSVLDGIAYVAGKDQYLHAISMKSGNSIWNWFTQVPLTNAPLAAGNLVALQVPEEGLVALSTTPGDKVSGLVLWKSKAAGNPITLTKEGLITWDDASRTMTLVETKAGGIMATAIFPNALYVASTAPVDGTIMLLCSDGRMQQLRPIEMMKSVMPSEAAGAASAKPKDVDQGAKAAEPVEEPAADDAAASESAP